MALTYLSRGHALFLLTRDITSPLSYICLTTSLFVAVDLSDWRKNQNLTQITEPRMKLPCIKGMKVVWGLFLLFDFLMIKVTFNLNRLYIYSAVVVILLDWKLFFQSPISHLFHIFQITLCSNELVASTNSLPIYLSRCYFFGFGTFK